MGGIEGMTKILTCSETGIPREVAKEMGITLVPYYVTYAGETYDELDLDPVKLYRWMRTKLEIPTTSHPTLEDFLHTFKEAGEDGSSLIYIVISSRYSKAYGIATLAKERLPELDLTLVDSRAGTGGQALLAIEAATLAREGKSAEGILSYIPELKKRSNYLMVFETLKYLARGGRIHRAKSLVGSILQIKPILTYSEEGETVPVSRVRTPQQGLDFIIRRIRADMERLNAERLHCLIEDADCREWADRVKERIVAEFAPEKIWQWTISPIVGVHVGPGAWGVAYCCP
jgi:DegV family protein with EDD domain